MFHNHRLKKENEKKKNSIMLEFNNHLMEVDDTFKSLNKKVASMEGGLLDGSSKKINVPSEIKPEQRVYVTYRGKALIARTANSFGYMYESIRQHKIGYGSNMANGFLAHPIIVSTDSEAEKMLPFLWTKVVSSCGSSS